MKYQSEMSYIDVYWKELLRGEWSRSNNSRVFHKVYHFSSVLINFNLTLLLGDYFR